MATAALEFVLGDLLAQDVDAIVNPANERLAHGAGVAGAIAAAAGPDLEEDSRRIGRCPTGRAVVTRAGRLPQRAVIHAVGPVWRGGAHREAALLRDAHLAVIARAAERGFARIALPAISTGVFGYPLDEAAGVAVAAVAEAAARTPTLALARFCFLEPRALEAYRRAAAEAGVA